MTHPLVSVPSLDFYDRYPPQMIAAMRRHGRVWLRKCRVKTNSPDLELLTCRVWQQMSEEFHRRAGDLSDACLIAGDLVDTLTDGECELLCEFVPELRARVPSEGVGGMTPEVTAIYDLLRETAGFMEDAWEWRESDDDMGEA